MATHYQYATNIISAFCESGCMLLGDGLYHLLVWKLGTPRTVMVYSMLVDDVQADGEEHHYKKRNKKLITYGILP